MLRGGGKYSSSSVTRDLLDAVARREPGDDGLDELLGRRRAGGDADRAGEVVGQLVGVVDPEHPGAAGLDGPASRAPGCSTSWPSRSPRRRRSGAPSPSAPTGGWSWRSTGRERPGVHSSGKRVAGGVEHAGPVAVRQRGLGQQRDRARRTRAAPSTSATDLDPVHGVGRHRHRADRLLVALVADVDDAGSPCRPAPSPRGGPW